MNILCAYHEVVAIGDLKKHPKNANQHPQEQVALLAKLIKYQGWRHPVIVSKRSGFVVAGHGRIDAAVLNQWTHVPVEYQDFESEAQEYAFLISDNELAELSKTDHSIVMKDVKTLGNDFDLTLLGIPDFKIIEIETLDPKCDEDHTPSAPIDPRTQKGDVCELGRHRLVCGDATYLSDFEKLMASDLADLVITDPPYNVAYEGKTKDALKIQNDSMSGGDFYEFLHMAYTNMLLSTKPGAGIYVFHADLEGTNFRKALVDSGFKLAQCCIWVKQSLVMGRSDYHWQHEPVLYGWNPKGSHRWFSDRKQTTVWNFNRPTKSTDHPTMKPIELLEYPLQNSSQKGDIVLDPFGGSGSTLIAAEKHGRSARLLELDPKYCDVIISRYLKYTGKTHVILNGEEVQWNGR